jgi:hypothetical protein
LFCACEEYNQEDLTKRTKTGILTNNRDYENEEGCKEVFNDDDNA